MQNRLIRGAALLVAVALIAWIAWSWSDWRGKAQIGAGYGARMTCSCRYVQGRGIDSCSEDSEPGMEIVTITDVPEERAVRASVPLMAKRTARFKPGWGCLLDPVE